METAANLFAGGRRFGIRVVVLVASRIVFAICHAGVSARRLDANVGNDTRLPRTAGLSGATGLICQNVAVAVGAPARGRVPGASRVLRATPEVSSVFNGALFVVAR